MKFTCEKQRLIGLISTAMRAVTGRGAMPVLESLRLVVDENSLSITGYDQTLGIQTADQVEVVEPGSMLLNARVFSDIVRKLPQDEILVECDANMKTTIKCGRAVFKLIAAPIDEFPELTEVSAGEGLWLPQGELKRMIAGTIFAVSENEAKPIHTGCLFDCKDGLLQLVAVDGYRLAVRRFAVSAAGAYRFVVPGSSLRELERILSEEDETPVEIFPDRKHILFRIGRTTVVTRLIEGEFIDYDKALPEQYECEVITDRGGFISCLERVSLLVTERLKNPVRLLFEKGKCKISCITSIGSSYDEILMDSGMKGVEIGFNSRYLLDALRAADGDEICLHFNGTLGPILMLPTEGRDFSYMVLPVRLRADVQ